MNHLGPIRTILIGAFFCFSSVSFASDDIAGFCSSLRTPAQIRSYLQAENLSSARSNTARTPASASNLGEAGTLRCQLNSCTFQVEHSGLFNGLGELAGPVVRQVNNYYGRFGTSQLHADLGYTRYEGGNKIEFGATPDHSEVLCLIGTLLKQANYQMIQERKDPLVLTLFMYSFRESDFTDFMFNLQGMLQLGTRALSLDAGLATLNPGSLQGVVANKDIYTIGSQLRASTGAGKSLELAHQNLPTRVGQSISAGDSQTIYFNFGSGSFNLKEDTKGTSFFTFIHKTSETDTYELSQCSLSLSEFSIDDFTMANVSGVVNQDGPSVVEGVRRLNPMNCSGTTLKLGQPMILIDRGFSIEQRNFSVGLMTGRKGRSEQGRLLAFVSLYRSNDLNSLLDGAVLNNSPNQLQPPIQSLDQPRGIFLTGPQDRKGK